MLAIWHGGDWLKEKSVSSKCMVRCYVEGPELVGFFIS